MKTKSLSAETVLAASQSLAPERAFIVQLAAQGPPLASAICGRVENVATGERASFASAEELTDFLRAVPPSATDD